MNVINVTSGRGMVALRGQLVGNAPRTAVAVKPHAAGTVDWRFAREAEALSLSTRKQEWLPDHATTPGQRAPVIG
ncbi:MAG: hypothetical protein ACREMY_30780 [bacterium]